MENTKQVEQMSLANAKKVIEQEMKERAERTKTRIEEILKEENCLMDVKAVLKGNSLEYFILYIPKNN